MQQPDDHTFGSKYTAYLITINIVFVTNAVAVSAVQVTAALQTHTIHKVMPYVTFTSCGPSYDDLCSTPTTPANTSDLLQLFMITLYVNCNSYKTKTIQAHPNGSKWHIRISFRHFSVLQDRQGEFIFAQLFI
jgi:hypothetical protein